MNLIKRMGLASGLLTRAEDGSDGSTSSAPLPPVRSDGSALTPDTALTLHAVFRAVMIHVTGAIQLSLDVERGGVALRDPLPLVAKPDPEQTRSAWIEQNVTSLALTGNAFWRLYRDSTGAVIAARVLNPHAVTVVKNLDPRQAPDGEKYSYYHNAERIPAVDVRHLCYLRVPGHRSGLGPIQAARYELAGVRDTRDYASNWFRDSGQASSTLTTEQKITRAQADEYRQAWYETPAGQLRVLGNGLRYETYALNPADAQWLDSQRFDVTRVARLMGAPASLMLASVEGGSQTYANVEQDWIGYVRFSLMKYLREIEEALSSVLPYGHAARFNIETLLRSDTKTRYEGYQLGIASGFLLRSEVRSIEHLPSIDGIDDQPLPSLPTTPAQPQEARP